jgi:hypothetical protein
MVDVALASVLSNVPREEAGTAGGFDGVAVVIIVLVRFNPVSQRCAVS